MPRPRHHTDLLLVVAMIAASVVVNLLVWPVVYKGITADWAGPPIPVSGGVFEVSLMPAQDAVPEEERLPEPEPAPQDDEDRVKFPGELVQLDRLTDERPPEDTDFVSEFDNRTDRQTKAPSVRRPRAPSDAQPGDRDQPGQQRDGSPSRTAADPKRLPLGRVPNDRASGQSMPADAGGDVAAGQEPRPPVGSLSPRIGAGATTAAMRKTFGGPSSIDHAEGVDEGDENILNTKRWKFASFFNRVRNAVDEKWEPAEVHKAHDPDGRVYGTKTRRTQLVIRLNPDGSLARIRLDHSSGAPHLDEEAIRAVRAAAPFVNPPPGLVDPQTGFIEFGFGFIFEFEGRRRIFRYFGP